MTCCVMRGTTRLSPIWTKASTKPAMVSHL